MSLLPFVDQRTHRQGPPNTGSVDVRCPTFPRIFQPRIYLEGECFIPANDGKLFPRGTSDALKDSISTFLTTFSLIPAASLSHRSDCLSGITYKRTGGGGLLLRVLDFTYMHVHYTIQYSGRITPGTSSRSILDSLCMQDTHNVER